MIHRVRTGETVSFHRCRALPGVEIRAAHETADFSTYSPDYAFVTADDWRGELWHRRQRLRMYPGALVVVRPGEVVLGYGAVPGTLRFLTVERDVLAESLAERRLDLDEISLQPFATVSNALQRCMADLQDALRSGDETAQLPERFRSFLSTWVNELSMGPAVAVPRFMKDQGAAELVRKCLHRDLSTSVNLAKVAEQTGMSRFRALRVFKSWYGLPPHAYQLRVRLALAQRSLRNGVCPAQAAAEYGFVDQSHLTRHFRRLLGVTPAEYARAG